VVQHRDLVRRRHGGQAVRDDEHGAPSARRSQRRLHERLGAGVERGSGLVKQQHARVLHAQEQHASAVKSVAAFWQQQDRWVRACSTARAMAMRCFWPPLSCTPRSPTCVA
jgi:hypothetical protein